ncbi:MAG: hypothetical protein RIT10_1662 [Bacteroidota bacterium]|jgi:hypothetical protein
MTLHQFIVPREKRVIVYTVLNKEIINSTQKSNYPANFQVDSSLLTVKRNELIALTTEDENLHSFIYVHFDGRLETDINVGNPKYDIHENYND